MIKTEEEIIFEPGEHIISFRSFFSSDNTVYHDKKRVDINYMTCPEGYELVNVSAFWEEHLVMRNSYIHLWINVRLKYHYMLH